MTAPNQQLLLCRSAIWQTAYAHALGTNSTGWSGYNMRQVVNSSLLLQGGASSRITIQAGSGGGCVVDHCFIGEQASSGNLYNFDGTQTQVFFNGGSASVTLAANGVITSDTISYAIDATKNLVMAFHFNAASQIETQGAISGAQGYFKLAADETSVSAVTGYSNATSLNLVNLIEVLG
jgi:hypothetical protein